MSAQEGDRYSVSIGGDATGPVVAGHGNVVETRPSDDGAQPSEQRNSVHDQGTLFAVTNGDMHVHTREPEK
ncbi:hypothetical protein [Saccharomonospora sp. NB11]|uniref:hypothetical protein n=1 Tax=Saccharomonospora sp. NB11 TaxID=1642298 RepID=UPI0018D0A306|nr:hypothetical protein [Saccharomonospora sp. NB11]